MNSQLGFRVLLVLSIALPTYGLECYECSGCNDEYTPNEDHIKVCGTLPEIPEALAKEKAVRRILGIPDVVNSDPKQVGTKAAWACAKDTVKEDGDEPAKTIRICLPASFLEEKDYCEEGVNEEGREGTFCICFGDRCNSATALGKHLALFLATVTALLML